MHVDFFIAGVQKGGTTALDTMLRRHPEIEMAARKEPHFFDNEALDWAAPDYELLHRFYDRAQGARLRGEATPIYTYWPRALERLQAYNSSAKLIIGLRHPAWRAFSHWRMEVSRSADTLDFSAAIRGGRGRVANAPGSVHRVFSYVERGFYAAQIQRIFELFPRQQVALHRTDQLWRHPQATLARVLDFLDLSAAELSQSREYIAPVKSSDELGMAKEDYRYLLDLFAADIVATAQLTGFDLSDWLSLDYSEPMTPGAA